MEVATEKLCII